MNKIMVKKMKNLILIGLSGAGKTTIGRYISNKLKIKQIDTDYFIEKKFNMSIEKIFDEYGEEWFRIEESKVVNKITNSYNIVISTGGGIVTNKKNIERLKKTGILFLLSGSIAALAYNLSNSNEKRPLISTSSTYEETYSRVEKLFLQREKLYVEASDYLIKIDNKTIEEIGEEIINIYIKH